MASDSDEIDHQLAADIETCAVSQLKEHLVPQLQKECDTCDEAMATAWQTIQSSIDEFNHKKRVMFATLKKVEGLERAKRVFHNDLNNMKPKALEQIVHAAMEAQVSHYTDHIPSPLASPHVGVPEDFDRRSFTYDADHPALLERPASPVRRFHDDRLLEHSSRTAVVGVSSPGKRKRIPLESRTPESSKKKGRRSSIPDHVPRELPLVQLKNDPLDSWEVEGQDYVFQWPKAGPGWFVVRCNIGDPSYLAPVHFTEHPFKNDHALNHFNGKGHSCHDTSRHYEPDDIISDFGFRVENSTSEKELDEDWAINSNERTTREAAKNAARGPWKTPKGKGKGKGKQPELVPTNRTALNAFRAPEADMGAYSDEGD